jgi:hypothetical protein
VGCRAEHIVRVGGALLAFLKHPIRAIFFLFLVIVVQEVLDVCDEIARLAIHICVLGRRSVGLWLCLSIIFCPRLTWNNNADDAIETERERRSLTRFLGCSRNWDTPESNFEMRESCRGNI